MRQQLRRVIFGASTLGGPQRVETGVVDANWPGIAIDRLTFEMEFGITSTAYLLHASAPNGRLAIYHEGHGKHFVARKAVILQLLAAGYDVAAFDMILDGRNNKPTVCLPVQGCVRFAVHNQMALLQPSDGHALRFLLEPVGALLHHTDYETVAMVGLSGGGWATTLMAALDERIDYSFPVAGSLPLSIRTGESMGDWEQMLPGVAHLVSYEDLYLMATSGGRYQMQILNRYDACCFANDGAAYYATVTQAANDLGGTWDLFVDESHKAHDISPLAMNQIMRVLDGH
jgi:hypothetical protein